jgi:carboxylesterase
LHDNRDNRPFLLEPHLPVKGAVLLVHGFTATPWEMRDFGEALADAGFLALGICLPGHGTTPSDLVDRRCEEWLAEVERGYQTLAERRLPVYGVGMSTGAMLLLLLASQKPFASLALLSPFLRLRHRLAPLVGLLRYVKRYQYRRLPENLLPYYYPKRPLNGIYQICRLIRKVRRRLGQITTPALIFSADGDRTVDAASARTLFEQLGSPEKTLHQFGREVSHALATKENPHWRETVEETLRFFSERNHPARTAPADG